jgi:hypothetical protein
MQWGFVITAFTVLLLPVTVVIWEVTLWATIKNLSDEAAV